MQLSRSTNSKCQHYNIHSGVEQLKVEQRKIQRGQGMRRTSLSRCRGRRCCRPLRARGAGTCPQAAASAAGDRSSPARGSTPRFRAAATTPRAGPPPAAPRRTDGAPSSKRASPRPRPPKLPPPRRPAGGRKAPGGAWVDLKRARAVDLRVMPCGGWRERIWSYASRAGDEARSMEAVVGGERPCGEEGSELGRRCGGGDGLEASAKGRKAETVSVMFVEKTLW